MSSKRLYVVADVLTLSRILAAAGLILLAVLKDANTVLALMCFVVGELFDALDGTMARYARRVELRENPNAVEPDRYIWIIADQATDVLLGIAVVIYRTSIWGMPSGSLRRVSESGSPCE